MKNYSLLFIIILVVIYGCQKDSYSPSPNSYNTSNTGTTYRNPHNGPKFRYSGSDYSQAIPIDEANTMIQSYLTSIKYPDNDSSLRSLTFDADSLRSYLNDTTHGRIVTLKFVVAHNQNYAASNYGKPAGLNGNAITLVLVGLDDNNNYIYNRNNMAYDHFQPCPTYCSSEGVLLK